MDLSYTMASTTVASSMETKLNDMIKIIEHMSDTLYNSNLPNLALGTTVTGNTKNTSDIITQGKEGSVSHFVDAHKSLEITWKELAVLNQIEFIVRHYDERTHYNITMEVSLDGIHYTTLCDKQQFEATPKIHKLSFPRQAVKFMRLSGDNPKSPYLHFIKFRANNKVTMEDLLKTVNK